MLLAVTDLEGVQALLRIALQEGGGLFRGKVVPVLAKKGLHGELLL
jgi:hypothetical protein